MKVTKEEVVKHTVELTKAEFGALMAVLSYNLHNQSLKEITIEAKVQGFDEIVDPQLIWYDFHNNLKSELS